MDGWMECTHYIRLALPYARSSPHSPFSFLLHHRRYSPMRRECASSGWVGEKTGKTRIMMIILHYITLHYITFLTEYCGYCKLNDQTKTKPTPKANQRKVWSQRDNRGRDGWGMGDGENCREETRQASKSAGRSHPYWAKACFFIFIFFKFFFSRTPLCWCR